MTEFTHGIQGALKKLVAGSSVGLALIYTLGHVVIAMTVVSDDRCKFVGGWCSCFG